MGAFEDAEEEFYGKTLIRQVNNWLGNPWFEDANYYEDYPEYLFMDDEDVDEDIEF